MMRPFLSVKILPMLRRLFLTFALAFLFTLGQQGAVLHEISHYSEYTGSLAPKSQQPDKSSHGTVCDKCISYGELASALAVHFTAPPVLLAIFEPGYFTSKHSPSRTYLAYSARAPPALA